MYAHHFTAAAVGPAKAGRHQFGNPAETHSVPAVGGGSSQRERLIMFDSTIPTTPTAPDRTQASSLSPRSPGMRSSQQAMMGIATAAALAVTLVFAPMMTP